MPRSLNEFCKPSQSLASRSTTGTISAKFESRAALIAVLLLLLYSTAAFVGNDWSYLIPAALIAALLVGVLLPLVDICSIRTEIWIVQNAAHAGEAEIKMRLYRIPLLSFLPLLCPGSIIEARLHLKRKTWKNARANEPISLPPLIIQMSDPSLEITVRTPQLPRGSFSLSGIEVATSFPFHITSWRRFIHLDTNADSPPTTITVYPNLQTISGQFHSRLIAHEAEHSSQLRNVFYQQQSLNLRGLREFSERDSLSHIHWASSAKSGKLLVREFEIENMPNFDILLDLRASWSSKQFELAVCTAYSLVSYGLSKGFSPQLLLAPSIDSELLAELFDDLKAIKSGNHSYAEILTRVMPLPPEKTKELVDSGQSELANTISNHRAVLGLLPDDNHPGSGNRIRLVEFTPGTKATQIIQTLSRLENDTELSHL